MQIIDVGTLRLTTAHINKAIKALKSNRLSYGPITAEFEEKFAQIHDNKYGIMTNSGTAALQAVLHAMRILYGWKDQDEIIMPATTFVATYNVILHNNLKPVLVDVGSDDLNIDPDLIEEKITKKTRALMPVHLLGKPAKMKKILKIARKYKLKVIEDSCETMFMDNVGTGDAACFSFYVAHLLVTGVGGMAITNDKKLADLIRSLIFHGRDNRYLKLEDDDDLKGQKLKEIIDARFRFIYPGYSARSTEIEAALGLVELENYSEMLIRRRHNAFYLGSHLHMDEEYGWFDDYHQNHAFMMFPYFSDRRDELMMFMERKGITTRTLMPLLNQPYVKADINKFPVSKWLLEEGMLFGCHQDLTEKDLNRIIKTIKEFEND